MNIIPFEFSGKELRTIVKDGDPWFVAKDVAAALGYAKPENAIARHCRKNVTTPKQGGGVFMIIPEPDVYRLIIKSKLPSAEKFERWLMEEVIPTIRKTGGAYLTVEKAEEILHNPDLIIGLAQQVKSLKAETKTQQQQIEADRPKVEFAETVGASTKSIKIGDYVKLISPSHKKKRPDVYVTPGHYMVPRE